MAEGKKCEYQEIIPKPDTPPRPQSFRPKEVDGFICWTMEDRFRWFIDELDKRFDTDHFANIRAEVQFLAKIDELIKGKKP